VPHALESSPDGCTKTCTSTNANTLEAPAPRSQSTQSTAAPKSAAAEVASFAGNASCGLRQEGVRGNMDWQALPSQGCGFRELRGERMIARRRLAGATVQVVVAATLAARERSGLVRGGHTRLVDLTFPPSL
jgi:hypothetical protein